MTMTQEDITEAIARHLTEAVLVTRGYKIVEPPTKELGIHIWAEGPTGEKIAVAPKGLVYVQKPEGEQPNSTVTGRKALAVKKFVEAVEAEGDVTAYVSFTNHPHGNHDKTLVTIVPVSELERVSAKKSRFVIGDDKNRLMFDFEGEERSPDGKPAEGVIEAILNIGPLSKPYTQSKK